MGVYTITVTLTPEEDAALHMRAADAKLPAEDLLVQAARLPAAPPDADSLLTEYHALVDLDLAGKLSPDQASRLKVVQEELDDLDEASPAAGWMEARMGETSDALRQLLQTVREMAARREAA